MKEEVDQWRNHLEQTKDCHKQQQEAAVQYCREWLAANQQQLEQEKQHYRELVENHKISNPMQIGMLKKRLAGMQKKNNWLSSR